MIRAQSRAFNPDLTLSNFESLDAFISRSTAVRYSVLLAIAAFAGVAVFLVAIGIHGLMSTVATQRYREFAVRMAFGATATAATWTIMKRGVALTLGGLALGTGVTLAVMPAMSALLFQIPPTDIVAYGTAAVVLGGISIIATYMPLRAVRRLEPMRLLRLP
jgi:ABC-type antimicrobial peptide transport system permease subunit